MAFKLIFEFIIPVYKTTKRVRRGFREMQDRMNQQYNGQNVHHQETVKDQKAESSDYSDFEEIK
jgi:hypothetical protein